MKGMVSSPVRQVKKDKTGRLAGLGMYVVVSSAQRKRTGEWSVTD